MMKDSNIKNVMILAGGLGYFILPADIIPDFIPGIGYYDDTAALYAAFKAAFSLFTTTNLGKAHEKAKSLLGEHFDEEQMDRFLKQAAETASKK